MFGISMSEITVIFIIAIILLGPHKLQEFAKDLGRAMRKFKNITNDIKEDFILDLELEKEEKPKNIIKDVLKKGK